VAVTPSASAVETQYSAVPLTPVAEEQVIYSPSPMASVETLSPSVEATTYYMPAEVGRVVVTGT